MHFATHVLKISSTDLSLQCNQKKLHKIKLKDAIAILTLSLFVAKVLIYIAWDLKYKHYINHKLSTLYISTFNIVHFNIIVH